PPPPPAPPPPPPPPPPAPPPPPVIPRDEIVTSIDHDDKKTPQDYVIDFSQLGAEDVDAQIDTGVTSGADPSEWDPIDIDAEGRVDSCVSDDGGKNSGNKGSAAVCQSSGEQQTETKH
ncbi:MAG TPA: hypothetical protein VNR86_09435, partial [Sphingomicrobium sp.]|nr:hypothetical protein [Sphingomicrobium sp.]